MEKVFWLMYLADLMGNFGLIGTVAVCTAGFALAAIAFCYANDYTEDKSYARAFSVLKWLALPIFIAVLLPSQKTVQILAVAAASDAVVSTQIGQKSIEALNAVLDRVINDPEKGTRK